MEHHESLQCPLGSSELTWNSIAGHVISVLHGLTRTTVKIMTEDEVVLAVRYPSEKFERTGLRLGQRVVAHVNAHDVLLGREGMSFGRERWNRWNGRIVLVSSWSGSPLITVKLNGKGCTLTSVGPVMGQPLRPEAWGPVTIVVDPENVIVSPHRRTTRDAGNAPGVPMHDTHRVWLKARIEAVRKTASGSVVSLDVGGAQISALVCGDQDIPYEWAPGLPVEMHVDQWEAWLRPAGDGIDAVMCKLIYETSL